MDEKPPVLSIFAQDSFFVLKWHSPRKRFQAFASESRDILRIKGSIANILRHCLFDCEARVIEHGLIPIKNSAIRIQDRDHLGYGINNVSKLSFECPCQGRLRSIALDGDSGNAAGVIDQ